MCTQKYQYSRLDDPSHQIRLVSIVSRPNRKRLYLELEVASIDEVNGQYEAVSYMWGAQAPERHVILNGKTLILRDNIWRCLKHLRDCDLTKSRLWIDTLCIDQSNEDEKSQQVAKMGHIFKNASRVLIWLGSTSLQTYMHHPGSDTLRDSIEALPAESMKDLDSWIDVLGHSDSKSQSLENQIMSIAYNPYWRRLWIIQENAFARKACIVFGKALLGNVHISLIYLAARKNSKPGYRSWIATQRDPSIENTGTGLLDHHPMLRTSHNNEVVQEINKGDTFSELIRSYHWQCCTDPRDYVFGLVGLLHRRPRFEVDYKSSNEEVAVRALQHLEEEGSQDSEYQLGLDLVAAAALLKALNVTSSTYLRAKQTLPTHRARLLQGTSFHLYFKPMEMLVIDDSARKLETKPYKSVHQLNISGNLMETIYQMKREKVLDVKLLNGRIKQFTRTVDLDEAARDSIQLGTRTDVVLWCCLSYMPALIIRRSFSEESTIKIEHFTWPDVTRPVHEPSPLLEIQLPKLVQDVLNKEINNCGVDWNELVQDEPPSSFLRLSALELISLCELISPQA